MTRVEPKPYKQHKPSTPQTESTSLATQTPFRRRAPATHMLRHQTIQADTTEKNEIIDVTSRVTQAVKQSHVKQGLLMQELGILATDAETTCLIGSDC